MSTTSFASISSTWILDSLVEWWSLVHPNFPWPRNRAQDDQTHESIQQQYIILYVFLDSYRELSLLNLVQSGLGIIKQIIIRCDSVKYIYTCIHEKLYDSDFRKFNIALLAERGFVIQMELNAGKWTTTYRDFWGTFRFAKFPKHLLSKPASQFFNQKHIETTVLTTRILCLQKLVCCLLGKLMHIAELAIANAYITGLDSWLASKDSNMLTT